MYAREKIVSQAKKWIGCKASNGTHKKIIDCYNNHKPLARGYTVKYTDSWCATFVSAVSIKCGYTEIIPTECSCEKMIALFKKLGEWRENENYTPKAGDIIFYDWQDSGAEDCRGFSDHVGIVEGVTNGNIMVIEGNKNNAVGRRVLPVNGKFIRGFGLPKYTEGSEPKETKGKKKSVSTIAREVIAEKWGNGSERVSKLKAAGYSPAEVQKKVNELLK